MLSLCYHYYRRDCCFPVYRHWPEWPGSHFWFAICWNRIWSAKYYFQFCGRAMLIDVPSFGRGDYFDVCTNFLQRLPMCACQPIFPRLSMAANAGEKYLAGWFRWFDQGLDRSERHILLCISPQDPAGMPRYPEGNRPRKLESLFEIFIYPLTIT